MCTPEQLTAEAQLEAITEGVARALADLLRPIRSKEVLEAIARGTEAAMRQRRG